MWDATKAVIKGKFIALNEHIRKTWATMKKKQLIYKGGKSQVDVRLSTAALIKSENNGAKSAKL